MKYRFPVEVEGFSVESTFSKPMLQAGRLTFAVRLQISVL
jgi:hypothetical protein